MEKVLKRTFDLLYVLAKLLIILHYIALHKTLMPTLGGQRSKYEES